MRASSHAPLPVGVVGAGALGGHHTRTLAAMPDVELVGVYDLLPEAARLVAELNGSRVLETLDELAESCEAAVVAVPTWAHRELGCALLGRGLHVLVEKPMAATLEEADALLAAAGDRVLAVGHVEYFNPAVKALLSLQLPPGFVEVHRLADFKPRSLDIDVILDLMIHDLQVLHELDPSPIVELRASGVRVMTRQIDLANVRMELESGCVVNMTASRVSDGATRKLRAIVPGGYYSVDYAKREVKGFRLEGEGADKRLVPNDLEVEDADPLERELSAFVDACNGGSPRYVDGLAARRALATALEIVANIEAAAPPPPGSQEERMSDTEIGVIGGRSA